ncbi:hypothetical protein NW761_008303 [Fusarium oxysporum]|uniref:Uncharacterized protein n=1 Tax=Fusarium oxysporum TaxID=5507 RepID=A0A2H3TUG7_FUSOX|nr:hypothetical protein NW758_006697 [Fusarium oxysporum]WKT52544.1 hypothetical protein QSH57_003058 [Fusarium oxysporum f. sp. vasinfectum]KAJ4086683.1 hypothetical protein NW761_008303 [Fusarium oxysporum]KAJ4103942.1 hypothetical protein NW769_009633 [Fusarium oxysporum]KAJ4222931.1 hypothetical protein NW760_010618 [Fusarium oxysporum]
MPLSLLRRDDRLIYLVVEPLQAHKELQQLYSRIFLDILSGLVPRPHVRSDRTRSLANPEAAYVYATLGKSDVQQLLCNVLGLGISYLLGDGTVGDYHFGHQALSSILPQVHHRAYAGDEEEQG